MELVSTNITVADFCKGLENREIQVNRDYQRSDKVWPVQAQSFLIETILLSFPMPSLYLHQQTDRISKKTIKYIVDGQQRSAAIKAFYDDKLRLMRTLESEAAGRTYSELSDDQQYRFLSYGLGAVLFVNTSEDEVREMFRRINSYEVPLNPEEQRHAVWQGEFKWYIYRLAKHLDDTLIRFGTFSDKQIVRMQDMKLLSEVSHALLYGITTTNKRSLDKLYKEHDSSFHQAEIFTNRIIDAVQFLESIEEIHHTPIMKPYSLYSLLLAILHVNEEVDSLSYLVAGSGGLATPQDCARRLSILATALEDEDEENEFADFVRASIRGTNVKAQREMRFRVFTEAISARNSPRFERI